MPRPIPSEDLPPIDRLREIMHLLRSPGGCPWDAEQTHESLVKHLIEEAYEVAEAVESGSRDDLVDELGDLLLQPIFHAEIASETGSFNFDDIAGAISEKLIRRHPHVFGEAQADDPDAVLSQWEEIKQQEAKKGDSTEGKSGDKEKQRYHLEKANDGLPALMAAQKVQKKAARVGFDWPSLDPVMGKIREETDEVESALEGGSSNDVAEEIGDLLFAVVNLSRKAGFEAELLLHQANRKFVRRFQAVEDAVREEGATLEEATLEELDLHWDAAKQCE